MPPTASGEAAARELILRHGWNSTVYQLLNPGIRHWFAPGDAALVGYVEHAGVRVVAGVPVGDERDLREVASKFERDARARGLSTCYFAVEPRWLELASRRVAVALMGAQPVWDPSEWPSTVDAHASLRAQLNRARNKGVELESWPVSRLVAGQPFSDALAAVRARWVDAHGLPPLHFLTGVDLLPVGTPPESPLASDRRLYVALAGGAPVAYLVASPIPLRRGWLVEQVIRDPRAPNGATELLIDGAVRDLAAAGARRLTLGLSPLSRRHRPEPAKREPTPAWVRLACAWAYAHGRRFYDFAGLEAFKEKFRPPAWEPIYLATSEPRLGPRALYAVAAAFTAGQPLRALAQGVKRAYLGRERLG